MNTQPLSPQGYNIQKDPLNRNPFWDEDGTGGNVPAGGTAGQVLTKRTDADYDTEWRTPEAGGSGLPEGGTAGDLLAKTADGAEWITPDFPTADDLSRVEGAAEAAQQAADAAAAAVTTETRAREAADTALGERIDATAQEITEHKTATDQALADLRAADTAEAAAREAADTALGSRIDNVASDLQHYEEATDAELQAQDAEDQRLDGLISAESTARMDADALLRQDLTADIQAEQQQREAADTAIRALIADAEGDIGDVGALVESIDTRVTATENDIADLKPAVQTATEKADAAAAEASQAAARALPSKSYFSSNSTTVFEPEAEDPVTSGSVPTGNVFYALYGYLYTNKIKVRWGRANSVPLRAPDVDFGSPRQPIIRMGGTSLTINDGMANAAACYAPFVGRFEPSHAGCLYIPRAVGNNPATDVSTPVSGGTAGQVLTKKSDNNYDWEWKTPESGGGSGLPSGGVTGDLLAKTADGAGWVTPSYASESDVSALSSDVSQAKTDISGLTGRVTVLETGLAAKADASTVTALAGRVDGKADASTVTALSGRVDTAEDDIDALQQDMQGKAEASDVSALSTRVTTLSNNVNAKFDNLVKRKPITLANEVKPTGILAAPFVYISPTGDPKFYGITDYQAPDAWANLHKNATDYSAAPIYYDTVLDGGAVVMQNSTYGDSQGRVYLAAPNKAGASWRFDIPGTDVPTNSAPTAEFVVRLTSVEDSNLVLYARATCQLPIQADDYITVKAWWHKVWVSTQASENHVGGPGDVSFTVANLGTSGWRVYVGIDGNYFTQFFGNGSSGAGYRWRTYHAADYIIGIK